VAGCEKTSLACHSEESRCDWDDEEYSEEVECDHINSVTAGLVKRVQEKPRTLSRMRACATRLGSPVTSVSDKPASQAKSVPGVIDHLKIPCGMGIHQREGEASVNTSPLTAGKLAPEFSVMKLDNRIDAGLNYG
jgi:hypothetical protein